MAAIPEPGTAIHRFGAAELDERVRELRIGGHPVPVEAKPFDVLVQLARRPGETLTKDELLDAVWPGRVVTEGVLAKCVMKLRALLGDDEQAVIRTVHGYGYRLGVPVESRVAGEARAFEPHAGDTVPHRPNWRLVRALTQHDLNQTVVELNLTKTFKRAVRDLQRGKEPDLSQPLEVVSEIKLHAPALLPSDYCSDVQERLTLYKRLANCETEDELQGIQEELIDRFGELPPQTRTLLETHRLRMLVRPWGVAKMDASEAQISIQFGPAAPIDPVKVIMLIQKDKNVRMSGPDKLIRKIAAPDMKMRVNAVRELLEAVKA